MPEAPLKFLIIDDNADSRFLLAKTLQRKFQGASILECHTGEKAVAFLSQSQPDVVIAHRTHDAEGTTLIKMLREVNATIPIVMVSGIDRREAAMAAGANSFLHYDEWLRIGTVVGELIKRAPEMSDVPDRDRN